MNTCHYLLTLLTCASLYAADNPCSFYSRLQQIRAANLFAMHVLEDKSLADLAHPAPTSTDPNAQACMKWGQAHKIIADNTGLFNKGNDYKQEK